MYIVQHILSTHTRGRTDIASCMSHSPWGKLIQESVFDVLAEQHIFDDVIRDLVQWRPVRRHDNDPLDSANITLV